MTVAPGPASAAGPGGVWTLGWLATCTVPASTMRALPAASVTTRRSRRAPSGTSRVSTSIVPRSACGHGGIRSSRQPSAGSSVPTATPPSVTATRRTPVSPSEAAIASGSIPDCGRDSSSGPVAEAAGSPASSSSTVKPCTPSSGPGQLHQPGPLTGEHQTVSSSPRAPAGSSRRVTAASPGVAVIRRAPAALIDRNAGLVLADCGLKRQSTHATRAEVRGIASGRTKRASRRRSRPARQLGVPSRTTPPWKPHSTSGQPPADPPGARLQAHRRPRSVGGRRGTARRARCRPRPDSRRRAARRSPRRTPRPRRASCRDLGPMRALCDARPPSNSRPSASSRRRTAAGSPSAVPPTVPSDFRTRWAPRRLRAREAPVQRARVACRRRRRAGDVAVAHPGAGRDGGDDPRQQTRHPSRMLLSWCVPPQRTRPPRPRPRRARIRRGSVTKECN